METVDVRSLPCPGPVLRLRDLLDGGATELRLLVGDDLARSNVTRFAESRGADASSERNEDGSYTVAISAGADSATRSSGETDLLECELPAPPAGKIVIQIGNREMGAGDDELGALLLRSFIKTIPNLDRQPHTMVFYNSGVQLCCSGSPVLEDLAHLVENGIEILVCGTCLNFFNLAEELRAGRVTDMLEIGNTLAAAGTTITP